MNTEVVQQIHEDLKAAMSELVKSAASDAKLLKEIQGRGFWQRLFANNIRDLAKAGIRQNELISNVQKAFQKLVCLVRDVAEQERQICVAIDSLRKSEDVAIAKVASKISDVADVACKAYFTAQKTVINSWLLLIKTNDSLHKESGWFLFLQLIFDFLDVCRSKNIQCEEESGKYIFAALQELGQAKAQKFTANQFAFALLDELEEYDLIEDFLKITDAVLAPVDLREVMNGSRAVGFRVLVQLAKKLSETKCVFDVLPKFLPDERARRDCRRLMIEQSVEGMDETRLYDYKQFADELVDELLSVLRGGREDSPDDEYADREASVAESVAENHGVTHSDIASALADGIAISSHAFLDTNPTEHEKGIYLTLFSLIDPAGESISASHYLKSLARLFGVELSGAQHQLNAKESELLIEEMVSVLASPERRCAWCLDVVFVACECGCYNDDVAAVLMNFGRKFGYKNDDVSTLLEMAHVVATETNPEKIVATIKRLFRHTGEWRSILEFRGVKLDGALSVPCMEEFLKRTELLTKIMDLKFDFYSDSDNWAFIGDEGCLRKLAIEGSRLKYRDKLKSLKDITVKYESMARSALLDMHMNALQYFYCPVIVVEGKVDSVSIPEDCSCQNSSWEENTGKAIDNLESFVDKFGAAIELGQKQIEVFARGDFNKCIIGADGKRICERSV